MKKLFKFFGPNMDLVNKMVICFSLKKYFCADITELRGSQYLLKVLQSLSL